MCGILGYGIAGMVVAIALVFGLGSMFNGLAHLGTSMALLGQTLTQPVLLLIVGVLGAVGGAGFVIGAPSIIRFLLAARGGRDELKAYLDSRGVGSRTLSARPDAPALPASTVHPLPVRRRRVVRRIDLDRGL